MKNLFKSSCLVVALLASVALVGCGGGGGSKNYISPVTSNVSVSIDASAITSSSLRAQNGEQIASLTLKTTAYLKGEIKNDIKVEDRYANLSGSNYICDVNSLLNGYDYRFSAYLNNGIKLMENHIAASELKNGEIPVNIDTSLKTLAYDSWKDKAPSNASVENFKQNCENAGLFDDKDFRQIFNPDTYKESLEKIAKGDENVSLPTKKDIDTTLIATTDVESTNKPVTGLEQGLIGKWYLNYVDNYHQNYKDFYSALEFKNDHTFNSIGYYYEESEYVESRKTNIRLRASLRFQDNPQYQEHISTGTWSLESNKLILNYTDGNKKNDSKVIFRNIVITNDSLSWTVSYPLNLKNQVITQEEIYKKTKWSKETKIPEPASATQALIGNWTLNTRNGKEVNSNKDGYLPSYTLNSDHTYSAKVIYMDNGKLSDYSTNETGNWYYEFGVIYFEPTTNTGYEYGYKIDTNIDSLKFYDEVFNSELMISEEVVYVFIKTQSQQIDNQNSDGNQDASTTYHIDYGDNGAFLKDYGNGIDYTPIKDAYTLINTVFQDETASAIAKADALGDYLSEAYLGSATTANDVSTKAAVVNRFRRLIANNDFRGMQLIPYMTNDGATEATVSEKTKLHIGSFARDGKTYKNLDYVFENIQWVNEGIADNPDWKIVGGFDNLGKTFDELSHDNLSHDNLSDVNLSDGNQDDSTNYHLDYGDNGAFLKDYGNGIDYTPIKDAYTLINTVFQDETASSIAKADALGDYLSEAYIGTDTTAIDVSTKAAVVKRFRSLIANNDFRGMQLIPYMTNDGATEATVSEKTKLHIGSFARDGKTYKNLLDYIFNDVKWVNEGTSSNPDWRIVGGFDNLGKTFDELSHDNL